MLVVEDQRREGWSRTINEGLRSVEDSLRDDVLLLNEDCVPQTDGWLAVLHKEMYARPEVWFVGPSGPCRTPPQNSGKPGSTVPPQLVTHLAGFCLLIHRDAIASLQRVDEGYRHYGSDVDLQWRARREHKKRSLWVPRVYVHHDLHQPVEPWWTMDQMRLRKRWRI